MDILDFAQSFSDGLKRFQYTLKHQVCFPVTPNFAKTLL